MSSVASHIRSFATEVVVSTIALFAAVAAVVCAAAACGLDKNLATGMAIETFTLFAVSVPLAKALFPYAIGYRNPHCVHYIIAAQIFCAPGICHLLDLIGESWRSPGNLCDVIFYSLTFGTFQGVVYYWVSQVLSRNVDGPHQNCPQMES